MQKRVSDHLLKLRPIKVEFLDGMRTTGTAEGNNAAWICECGEQLIGRCYYQFGQDCHTTCEKCGRTYRVTADSKKKALTVVESAAFFGNGKRTISEIREELGRKGHTFKGNEVSPGLVSLTKSGILKREKNAEKQWIYFAE